MRESRRTKLKSNSKQSLYHKKRFKILVYNWFLYSYDNNIKEQNDIVLRTVVITDYYMPILFVLK